LHFCIQNAKDRIIVLVRLLDILQSVPVCLDQFNMEYTLQNALYTQGDTTLENTDNRDVGEPNCKTNNSMPTLFKYEILLLGHGRKHKIRLVQSYGKQTIVTVGLADYV